MTEQNPAVAAWQAVEEAYRKYYHTMSDASFYAYRTALQEAIRIKDTQAKG